MDEAAEYIEVHGIRLKFPHKHLDRAREAVQLLEERYAKRAERSGGMSEKVILTTVALGLAEEVLQLKDEIESINRSIQSSIEKIEKFEQIEQHS
mgnify:CR=1 FL=1